MFCSVHVSCLVKKRSSLALMWITLIPAQSSLMATMPATCLLALCSCLPSVAALLSWPSLVLFPKHNRWHPSIIYLLLPFPVALTGSRQERPGGGDIYCSLLFSSSGLFWADDLSPQWYSRLARRQTLLVQNLTASRLVHSCFQIRLIIEVWGDLDHGPRDNGPCLDPFPVGSKAIIQGQLIASFYHSYWVSYFKFMRGWTHETESYFGLI